MCKLQRRDGLERDRCGEPQADTGQHALPDPDGEETLEKSHVVARCSALADGVGCMPQRRPAQRRRW